MGDLTKSKACHNCKKRKLKCDSHKPACQRCEKAQIACQGYKQGTLFVNKFPSTIFNKGTSVPKHNITTSTLSNYDVCLQNLKLQLREPTWGRLQLRNQSLDLLRKLYMPQLNQTTTETSSFTSWLPMACYLQGESHALDHALYTFCLVQVAISRSTAEVGIDEALQIYYDSLQVLRVELEDENAAHKDETLAAISVLSTCELFVCPTDHAWQAHAQGISEIIRIRGDLDLTTPVRMMFYFRIRMILLFEALTKRTSRVSQCKKPVFAVNKQNSFDNLIFIAWEVPLFLEESEKLMASNTSVPEQLISEAFNNCLNMIEKLQKYLFSYRDEFEQPPYWVVPSRSTNPADDLYDNKLFPFALNFLSIDTAVHTILCWAIMLQVHYCILSMHSNFSGTSIISSTTPSLSSETPGQSPVLVLGSTTAVSTQEEADKIARYLCQSIEFCYQTEYGTFGPQLTCYAQWIMKLYFRLRHLDRELAWCMNIKHISGPGCHSGIDLMCFQSGVKS